MVSIFIVTSLTLLFKHKSGYKSYSFVNVDKVDKIKGDKTEEDTGCNPIVQPKDK